MDEKISFSQVWGKCMDLPLSPVALEDITNGWKGFSEDERQQLVKYYFSLDAVTNRGKTEEEQRHVYPIGLWQVLGQSARSTMIDIVEELGKDYFFDAVFSNFDVDTNTPAFKFLEDFGYSKADITRIYIHNRNFTKAPVKALEDSVTFLKGLGISDELINENPLLLSMLPKTLYAKMRFLEQLGEDFSKMDQEAIDKLVISDVAFDKIWGDLLKEELREQNPNLYAHLYPEGYELRRPQQINATMNALRGLNPMTEEMFNMIMDKGAGKEPDEVWESLGAVKIKDMDVEWILPPAKAKPRRKETRDEQESSDKVSSKVSNRADGLTPEEVERELKLLQEAKAFKERLIETFGPELEMQRYKCSKGGSTNFGMGNQVTYSLFNVGEYTLLEPIGQFGNATYMVPTLLLDTLDIHTRQEVTRTGIGFKIDHPSSGGVYDYSSNHLFRAAESLKEAQEENKCRLSQDELLNVISLLNEQGKVSRDALLKSHTLKCMFEELAMSKAEIQTAQQAAEQTVDYLATIKKDTRRKYYDKKSTDTVDRD